MSGLADFGFREITPAEERRARERVARCNHFEHADHRTIEYSSGRAGILGGHSLPEDGFIYVTCPACRGTWAPAQLTALGAQDSAYQLRKKANGRYIQDAETKAHFRRMAAQYEAYARGMRS